MVTPLFFYLLGFSVFLFATILYLELHVSIKQQQQNKVQVLGRWLWKRQQVCPDVGRMCGYYPTVWVRFPAIITACLFVTWSQRTNCLSSLEMLKSHVRGC